MLPKQAPRFHFMYINLSNMKFQQKLLSLKTDAVKLESQVLPELPMIWSKSTSYLCENVAKDIVREVTNKPLTRKSGIEEELYVYPHVLRRINAMSYKFDTKSNQIQHFIPKLKETQEVNHTMLPITFQSTQLRSKQNSLHYSNRHNAKDNNLPSDAQLDEMMLYFQQQAHCLFKPAGWSYRKCSYKILFENMMIGTRTESLNAYILQINVMKSMINVFYFQPELSILRMTKNLSEGTIYVRWQVQGMPRLLKPFSMFGIFDEKRFFRYIDGFSIFYVLNDGLYHRHILTKTTPLRNEDDKSLASHFLSRLGLPDPAMESLPKQPTPAFKKHFKRL